MRRSPGREIYFCRLGHHIQVADRTTGACNLAVGATVGSSLSATAATDTTSYTSVVGAIGVESKNR